jgi:pimeloyl-ACP methyl ester carboxylesterase
MIAWPPPGLRRITLPHAAIFAQPGRGPAILCIPGGYHSAFCFGPWLGLLAKAGIAAAALEPRGKGSLAAQADPATGIADYAQDAAQAARALGQPVVLLGHSLGALVAMRAAEVLGDAAGIVLVAPSPPGNLPGAAPVPPVAEGAMLPPPDIAAIRARYFGGQEVADINAYRAALSAESPRVLNDRYQLRIPIAREMLQSMPGLVIEAGRDDAARHPPGQDQAIADFFGLHYWLLPDMPHCMMCQPWAEASLAPIIAWHGGQFGQ